jgi:COP9 signalosome complex subunit 3
MLVCPYLTFPHNFFFHFSQTCVSTRNFLAALPVLSYPITNFDTSISPELHYSDNLSYHYTGGIALAALKRWAEAEEYFEICVTSPGTYPAALQLEALKKLRLVQLISGGKVRF